MARTKKSPKLDVGVGTWTNRLTGVRLDGALVCNQSPYEDERLWDSGKKHFFVVAPQLKLTALYRRVRKMIGPRTTPAQLKAKVQRAGMSVVPL